jgi:hypothetical protein
MVDRPRPKFLPIRDPAWRHEVALRVGVPVLGTIVAVAFAWLIIQV